MRLVRGGSERAAYSEACDFGCVEASTLRRLRWLCRGRTRGKARSMAKVRRCCSEALTVQGAWWERASPDQQASGAFTWDPSSGGELQVTGFFHDGSGSRSNWRGDVLYGVAEQAEFTLIDCREVGLTMQSPGVMRQRLHPFGGILVGAMVPDVTQPVLIG